MSKRLHSEKREISPAEARRILEAHHQREPSAKAQSESKSMKPYIEAHRAQNAGQLMDEALSVLVRLPLEKRYLTRVCFGLETAFADYDSSTVRLDKETMKPDDLNAVYENVEGRASQFCLLLKALFGRERAAEILKDAASFAEL